MSQFFSIHPETPQSRLINQAVEILAEGGVIAYPTDSAYALGCRLDNKAGAERIRSAVGAPRGLLMYACQPRRFCRLFG